MEKETKKLLVIGGAIVLAVGIGVILWKKYQSSSVATEAAQTQSSQDELELVAASLANNAYAGQSGGAQPFTPAVTGGHIPQSLADEILAIEKALGLLPEEPPAPTTPQVTTPPTTPPTETKPSRGSPSIPSPAHHAPPSEIIRYNHGMPLFEIGDVNNEGALVS